ncbi:MAG: DUF2268 domain-containing putative Zn-dependent protease [Rhodanobacteraceae bacterium]
MSCFKIAIAAGIFCCAGSACATTSAVATDAGQTSGPVIHIEDVARFYEIYQAAGRHPGAKQLQHDYLDAGSDGLHLLAKLRNVTGKRIAENIEKHPDVYSSAKRCMVVLPRVRERLHVAFRRLREIYPQAAFPPVTIAVGRGKPVGVTDASGVMIGLEALCAINYLDSNVEDRFVHVIAHEYAHVQQAIAAPAVYDDPKPTVLEASLIEGAAEFMAERISGSVAYVNLKTMTRGDEKKIETAFAADENKTDLSDWLNNGTLTKPGDLGYRVGYRIVKSYYRRAADKRRAIREILGMSDPKAFLARSGWYTGIRMGPRADPREADPGDRDKAPRSR